MMRPRVLVAFLPALVFAACSSSKSTTSTVAAPPAPAGAAAAPSAKADIEARSGSTVSGTATFTETGDGVRVSVDVSGVPEGVHAVHLHEAARLDEPSVYTAGARSRGHMAGPVTLDQTVTFLYQFLFLVTALLTAAEFVRAE